MIVVGKPAIASDADNEFMTTYLLASCLVTAKGQQWNAGVMSWEYPHANTTWITAVRASTWPVGSTIPAPSSSASTSSSTAPAFGTATSTASATTSTKASF